MEVLDSWGLPPIVVATVLFILPVAILVWVANERGQSQAYCLFGLLGWPGLIVGLLIMIAMPRSEPWR